MTADALRESRLKLFDQLIARGEVLGLGVKSLPGTWEPFSRDTWRLAPDRARVQAIPFMEWRADCVLFLGHLIPQGSSHWHVIHEFRGIEPEPERLAWALGFLRALRSSYADGVLEDQAGIVEKQVLLRLLGQAEKALEGAQAQLFEHLIAAMLAAAVLDSVVRTVCARLTPPVHLVESNGDSVALRQLLKELHGRAVLNDGEKNILLALAAVHGHVIEGAFDAIEPALVGSMINAVRVFIQGALR